MPTYTFFLEFQGGTYTSQVHATDFREAPAEWINNLDLAAIPNHPATFREHVIKSLEEFEMIVPITGIKKTWSCSLIYVKGITLHFTETAEDGS